MKTDRLIAGATIRGSTSADATAATAAGLGNTMRMVTCGFS